MPLHLTVTALALAGGILVTAVEGVRRRDPSATVNALVALAAAVLPLLLGWTGSLVVPPSLAIWVALAGLLHAVGMLGPYDTVWWWDHLTHGVSAALVAALAYAAFLVVEPAGISAGAATLGVVVLLGVAWELVELVARDVAERFDVDPVLVYYGWRDTALDLVFDVLGAILVVAFDIQWFRRALEPHPEPTRAATLGVVAVTAVAAVGMTAYLLLVGRPTPAE